VNPVSQPASSGDSKLPGNEEPTPVSEFDVSSDGRDEYGEEMIRELPRNPDLAKLKVAPQPTNVLPLKIVE